LRNHREYPSQVWKEKESEDEVALVVRSLRWAKEGKERRDLREGKGNETAAFLGAVGRTVCRVHAQHLHCASLKTICEPTVYLLRFAGLGLLALVLVPFIIHHLPCD
jgi:hypothetical protein